MSEPTLADIWRRLRDTHLELAERARTAEHRDFHLREADAAQVTSMKFDLESKEGEQ